MRALEGVDEKMTRMRLWRRNVVTYSTLESVLPSLPIWIIYPSQVGIHHIFSPQTKQVRN